VNSTAGVIAEYFFTATFTEEVLVEVLPGGVGGVNTPMVTITGCSVATA
jgi:hypothetical protein